MQQAVNHLYANDKFLRRVIDEAGLCTITPHTNYYWELVDSIISQQLSVKAAATIMSRFKLLFSKDTPLPGDILAIPHNKFRAAGLSNAKANYIRDLAQHIVDGRLDLSNLDELSNDEIIVKLTAVKGIGEWTAHMFMMFAMGRLDVLAIGDLGIKLGVQKLYGLDNLPTPAEITNLAVINNWHPYETVACWYIWHAKDNK